MPWASMAATPGMTAPAVPSPEGSCRAAVLHISLRSGRRALHAGRWLRTVLGPHGRLRRAMILDRLITCGGVVVYSGTLIHNWFMVHRRLMVHRGFVVHHRFMIHRRFVVHHRLMIHCRAMRCRGVNMSMRVWAHPRAMSRREMGRATHAMHMARVVPMPAIPRCRAPVRHQAGCRKRAECEYCGTRGRVAIHRLAVIVTKNRETVGIIARVGPGD